MTSAGGGSGGAVHIDTDTLVGHGKIYANGGAGSGKGGGGSGGRINVLYVRGQYQSGNTHAKGTLKSKL